MPEDAVWSDDRLIAALEDVGPALVIGDTPAPSVVRGPGRTSLSRWVVAAAVAVVALAVSLLIEPTRTALADLFGLGSTTVTLTEERPFDTDDRPRLGDESSGVPLTDTVPRSPIIALGPPDVRPVPDGTLYAWPEEEITLWVRDAVQGLPVQKIAAAVDYRDLSGLGDEAVAIEGDHLLVTPGRTYAAGPVVIWIAAGRELRLEGPRPIDELVELARSVDL